MTPNQFIHVFNTILIYLYILWTIAKIVKGKITRETAKMARKSCYLLAINNNILNKDIDNYKVNSFCQTQQSGCFNQLQ